jgi:CubicO group peptidase (beta-lactamase class C family)
MPYAELDALAVRGLGERYSAIAVRIERAGRVVYERAAGVLRSAGAEPVYPDTRFDLASITKVFVATVALVLVERGELALDAPLTGLLPEWRATPHAAITLRDLLAHRAGLQSGADYRTLLDVNVEAFALRRPLVAAPRERVIYSDLGFIVLGTILARRAGIALRTLIERELRALGAAHTTYEPRTARDAVPATERDAWRGLVQGTVHDEKAHLAGGVAGHAGLFGDARDVARLGEWYLAALRGRSGPLPPEVATEAVLEQAADPILRRGLGWALKTTDENSCGPAMSRRTFGHTGFTGTCLWVDPERDLSVVVLSNAVHYGRRDLRDLRAAICDAACALVPA